MARKIAGRSKKTKAKRSKGGARPKRVAVRACAACGLPERDTRRLVTRSALSVCEACVLEFARELHAGAAVAKPETAAPELLHEGMTPAPAPAEICGWQKFR